MKITTEHSRSSYGIPVVLDDAGEAMDYAPGLRAVRDRLGLSVGAVAELTGVSPRTVEGWEQGRPVGNPAALYVLADLLAKAEKSRVRPAV
jgi:DNA-binding transcriptional regulator YiaG